MQIWEIAFLGAALAMDACAVAMTDGMTEPKMPAKRVFLVGGFFGFFQFLMPLIGYFISGVVASAFLSVFKSVSAWISFLLLAFLGGKAIVGSIRQMREYRKAAAVGEIPRTEQVEPLTMGKLCVQAVATSIDALAVGVTLQMAAISESTLALGAWGATLLIGGITFLLSVGAAYIGKLVGDRLADKAELFGGVVLVAIGLKILLEGLL